MDPHLFGEFMGTLVLVLIGNGVVANVVLKKTLGSGAGWLTIVFGYGLGVVAGVFVAIACGSSDAHINPAVSLAMLIAGKLQAKMFAGYVVAQLLGAFVGAILVWLHFMPHWKETPDAGSKLACFSTGPAIKNMGANFISEVIGTFLLVVIIASIVKTPSLAPGLAPFLIGATVWGIGSGLGGTTGFAINPARDLGPRMAHAILPIPGKGGSEFGYGLAVPVVAGLVGGALAGVFIMFHL
jgi:glycerol uptake facilitator protein